MNIIEKVYKLFVCFIIGVLLTCSTPIFSYADEITTTNIENKLMVSKIIDALYEQLNILEQQIQEQEKENNYQNRINQVRELALNYLGVPYVWGGTSPCGFDCSGFVQYVYRECGIELPRTTYSQINCGEYVSLDSLTIGDIVFFGDYHVGIYIGDYQYVHAPTSGDVVKIQSMNSYCPTSARRLIFRE